MNTIRRTTRRRFLILAGGSVLAVTGCGGAAGPVARAAAPWVGQFLLDVGVNVVSDRIGELFAGSDDEELALMEPARAQLIRGGFTDSVSKHFAIGSGISDAYRGGGRIAFCQVDGRSTFETCVGVCNVAEGTWVAVEGPVLGALHLTNVALASEGLPPDEIDELTTPLELAKPRGEIAGEEMRFDVPFAIRRYRTRSGPLQVTWERGPGDAGACLVDIHDGDLVFEVEPLEPEGQYV